MEGTGKTLKDILPADLWSLGKDMAQLISEDSEPGFTHLYTHDDALHVLRTLLARKVRVVLWAITHYHKRKDKGWNEAEYCLLWDGDNSRNPMGSITLLPLEAAIEFSLKEGIKALSSRHASNTENDRYELQLFEDN